MDPRAVGGGASSSNRPSSGRALAAWVLGALLLGALVLLTHLSVGWGSLLTPWKQIGPGSLVVSLCLVMGSYAVRGIRIHQYFRPATSGRFLATFRLVLLHNLLNNLLPMRSGEASFPILMSRQFGVGYSRSIPALVFLRILDLHFVVLLAMVVLALDRGIAALGPAIILAPLPYGIFLTQAPLGRWLKGKPGRWRDLAREVLRGLPSSSGLFWQIWIWTAVNWSVKLVVLAWILQAFSSIPFPHALIGTTTGELSSVLPIHGIAGAGTYEGGVLAGLLPLGVSLDEGVQAAVNLHLFVLGVSILAGALGALLPGGAPLADERAGNS